MLAAAFPDVGIGLLGVSLAFGLTVLTMAYAVGHISGCHLNPAVSVGLWAGGRFPAKELLPYIVAQVAGAVAAAACSTSSPAASRASTLAAGFASNGYGEHSPGGYSLLAALVTEVVMTFMFLLVILGSTDKRAPAGLRAHRHRPRSHAHPPDQHPGHQHVGESRRAAPGRRSSWAAGPSRSSGSSGWRPIAGALLAGAVFRALFEQHGRHVATKPSRTTMRRTAMSSIRRHGVGRHLPAALAELVGEVEDAEAPRRFTRNANTGMALPSLRSSKCRCSDAAVAVSRSA